MYLFWLLFPIRQWNLDKNSVAFFFLKGTDVMPLPPILGWTLGFSHHR